MNQRFGDVLFIMFLLVIVFMNGIFSLVNLVSESDNEQVQSVLDFHTAKSRYLKPEQLE